MHAYILLSMHICFDYEKRGEVLDLLMFIFSFMHICVEPSLHIFMFIAMHELRGSFYEA